MSGTDSGHSVDRSLTPAGPDRSSATSARTTAPTSARRASPSNQLVQHRLLGERPQPSLAVSDPEDEHEREADAVADAIMRRDDHVQVSAASPTLSRAAADDKKKKVAAPPKPAGPAPKPPTPAVTAPKAPQPPTAATPQPGTPAQSTAKVETPPAATSPAVPGKKATDTKAPPPTTKRPERGASRPAPTETEKKEADDTEAAKQDEKKKEENNIATKSLPGHTPRVTPGVSAGIHGQTGGGRTLGAAERSFFEPRFQRDLSQVRLHDDSAAHGSTRDLEAQAFTYGSHVFFGAGRYQPGTFEGKRLLAHEIAHTLQQRPGTGPSRLILRAPDPPPAAPPQPVATPPTPGVAGGPPAPTSSDATQLDPSVGRLDDTNQKVVFSQIRLPQFKVSGHRQTLYHAHRPLQQAKAYSRGEPAQREKWRTTVQLSTAAQNILKQKHDAAHAGAAPGSAGAFVFKANNQYNQTRYFIGDLPTISQALTLPTWGKNSQGHAYDVDHIVELQLAGWPGQTWANELDNMELLDSSANRSSGSRVKQEIDEKVDGFKNAANADSRVPKSRSGIKDKYTLEFTEPVPGDADPQPVGPDDFWTREEIQSGAQLSGVQASNLAELGQEGSLAIFPDGSGGTPKTFRWPGDLSADERNWLAPFVITTKNFDVGSAAPTGAGASNPVLGTLSVNLPANDPDWLPFDGGDQPVTVTRITGAQFAGYIDKQAVKAKLRSLRHKRLSPIQIDEPDIFPGRGIVLTGRILPDAEVFRGAGIDFELSGHDLRVFKEFSLGEIHVPRPFVLSDTTLAISLGTQSGLQVTGEVDFGIERVGHGFIRAAVGTQQSLGFDGEFNFDSQLFDPARLAVHYHDAAWSGDGDLGIPEGKVPGIRRGLFHASYGQEMLRANGTAELSIPGVQSGALDLSYSEAQGLRIAGSLTLANNIPGIRGGSVDAEVQQRPDAQGYKVHAHGQAQPAMPGIDASLDVLYDDGAFTVAGSAAYARGLLHGQLTVGATNRPVDAQGNPVADAAPTEHLTAYGGGTATVQLAPWLQGTIGIRLLGNGELEISGGISLPQTLQLFEEKAYNRDIFTIGLDIPIVGVAVAGIRVGIFATISGGLTLSAGIGPGQLQQLALTLTYNPDHEDRTHVVGGAQLHIPAHAGLRLFVRGGLGVGIPLVSATAGLEVGGELGLLGSADAGVQIDWTPARGLVLDAAGSISVEPRFVFDVSGFVLVEAGIGPFTASLYDRHWQLARMEYGSGLRLGMRFPIHYEEGKPFDVSWNDVQFDVPSIDAKDVLTGLIHQIA
jgi:hypothetical protein